MNSEQCEGCIYGKTHRLPFGIRAKTTKPGERVHTDVCGPFQESMSWFKYFVLFKDDYTKFRTIYFLKKKSEVAEKLSQFLAKTKIVGHVIKKLLSDNEKEFDNNDVRSILQKEGIIQRLTMPYIPEQNGSSERENRTVVETARAMMHAHGNIPQTLWAQTVKTSPYELWYDKKPGLKHLRVISSACYDHVPKQTRKKMDPKATKGILIGYDHDDGYRIFDKEECKLIQSRDVVFGEKTLEHTKTDRDELTDDDEEEQETEDTSISGTSESDCEHNADKTTRCLRDRSTLKTPEKLQNSVMHFATSPEEPEIYGEATKALPQSKEALLKSYRTRLKDDVKSMLENFEEIVKLAKGEHDTQLSRMTQCEQDTYEMHVRAANIVRAGESLMKLVSDIKQYLILNDFPSVNEAITQNSKLFRTKQAECDQKLMSLRDDIAADLYDLEEEYYSSLNK
ncbi:hypothetical protein GEV33_006820 [Tenebrio molitor]|uniref:Integrase catalytic domain-containing protein n=1 Tax=Tenebrio molitor TaxID=7067 RepID=A0A8J6HJX1_TENMO|nr:hypothetical protein GEV33_006820 [Tenebrio molitor]